MEYPINWQDGKEIRRLFTYQTRIGLAPKVGRLSIGRHQPAQDNAYLDVLIAAGDRGIVGKFTVRKVGNKIQARQLGHRIWVTLWRIS